MNWEAIGAIGEILGAFAVVATLVYLATQIRYAKEAASDANRIARATGVREFNLAMATNEKLRESYNKATGILPMLEEMAQDLDISVDEMSRVESGNSYWFWLHWGHLPPPLARMISTS